VTVEALSEKEKPSSGECFFRTGEREILAGAKKVVVKKRGQQHHTYRQQGRKGEKEGALHLHYMGRKGGEGNPTEFWEKERIFTHRFPLTLEEEGGGTLPSYWSIFGVKGGRKEKGARVLAFFIMGEG